MSDGEKECRRCGGVKILAEFGANSASRDGKMARCRACVNESAGLRRKKLSPEERREKYWRYRETELRSKFNYRERHREEVAARIRQYRSDNPEKVKQWKHDFWERHVDELRAKQKVYRGEHPDRVRATRNRVRCNKAEWVRQFKAENRCQNCGESDPVCLEFHHRMPSEKLITVNKAVADNLSWERLLDEIAKCELLCANCHRKRHAEEVTRKAGGRD